MRHGFDDDVDGGPLLLRDLKFQNEFVPFHQRRPEVTVGDVGLGVRPSDEPVLGIGEVEVGSLRKPDR